jgi:hypothetical protein
MTTLDILRNSLIDRTIATNNEKQLSAAANIFESTKEAFMKTSHIIGFLRKNILMIACILFFVPTLEAQQIVKGQITDATDGLPVEGANIFIANTTIGTSSDEMGNFSITVSGNGSFEIVVSHVAYKSNVLKINTPQSFHRHDVALEINELQEIVVTARSRHKQKDINLFWSKILGEKPSKEGMEVLNPDKVYFFLNNDKILKVSCKEPIEVINHQMGYRIKYVLNNFQHDYRKKTTTFSGMPHFEELIPQDDLQKNRWEKKRQEVYAFSTTHFFRALYRKQIHKEGFLLIIKDSSLKGQTVPLNDILQTEQGMLLANIEVPLLLMCYSKPVTANMIKYCYDDYLRNDSYPIVIELLPQQFIIYPDGTYSGILQTQVNRSYIFGLSTTLPVEYGK